MSHRVVLHIGTMKSGTTYLQRSLESGVLDDAGGFYVGGTFGVQTKAVRGILGAEERQNLRVWNALASEVRRRDGVAVYSQEFLGFARRSRARQIVETFEGTPVDVVITVRDQHGAMAAQWQSFVRNRGTDDWATYVRRLLHRADEGGAKAVRTFHRAQDVPQMLRRWNRAGAHRVSVVVVPPAGAAPTELWHRFCDAADLTAGDPPQGATRSNESLGYASCEVMSRLNVHYGEVGRHDYRGIRKTVLEALLPLRPEEGRPELDRAGAAHASELNGRIVAALDRHGTPLVGAREELPVHAPDGLPDRVPPPDPAHVERALEAVWAATGAEVGLPRGDVDAQALALARRLLPDQA